MRVHFCRQHWLLCHLGWYQFEFELALWADFRGGALGQLDARLLPSCGFGIVHFISLSKLELELKLDLIQIQMTQKPLECTCVAQTKQV